MRLDIQIGPKLERGSSTRDEMRIETCLSAHTLTKHAFWAVNFNHVPPQTDLIDWHPKSSKFSDEASDLKMKLVQFQRGRPPRMAVSTNCGRLFTQLLWLVAHFPLGLAEIKDFSWHALAFSYFLKRYLSACLTKLISSKSIGNLTYHGSDDCIVFKWFNLRNVFRLTYVGEEVRLLFVSQRHLFRGIRTMHVKSSMKIKLVISFAYLKVMEDVFQFVVKGVD